MSGETKDGPARAGPLLRSVSQHLQKKFGKESAIVLTRNRETTKIPYWISTGALNLDGALGGGLAGGRVVELYSLEASEGKTTCAAHIAKACQTMGGFVVYADVEQSVHEGYFATLGVDVEDNFLLSRPDTLEHLFDIMQETCETIRERKPDIPILFVVDSVAATQTRAQLEADWEKAQVAEQARAFSSGLRKLVPVLSNMKATLLLVNQGRVKIGVWFGDPSDTPGGKALKFYASQRVVLRKAGVLRSKVGASEDTVSEKEKTPIIGIRIEATVKKNKVGVPFQKAAFDLYFGRGIDYPESVFQFGVDRGVLIPAVGKRGKFAHAVYGGEFSKQQFKDHLNTPQLEKIHTELRAMASEVPAFLSPHPDDEEEEEKEGG